MTSTFFKMVVVMAWVGDFVGLFTTIMRWGLFEAVARLTEIVGFIGVEEAPATTEAVDAAIVDEGDAESMEEPPRVAEELLF
jgi:hypothetical protein